MTNNLTDSKPVNKAAYDEVASTLRQPRFNRTLTLANGKVVGFSDVGDSQGAPVLVFLGLAGHRYLGLWFAELAKKHGLRILVVERPGKGTSWRLPPSELRVLEWPGVVEEVAAQLGIERFSVIGHSCGTIFALACGLQISQRIVGPICLVSPWTSLDVEGSNVKLQRIRHWPGFVVRSGIWLTAPVGWYLSRSRDPDVNVERMKNYLSITEAAILREPRYFAISKQARDAARLEAGRQGFIVDTMLCLETYQHFGFLYTDIQHPVHVFHGDRDDMVPLAAVQWMRDKMPDCKVTVTEEGTHKLLADNRMLDQMFAVIANAHQADRSHQEKQVTS